MTTTGGRLESIYSALLAIINNIAPYAKDLQRATSSKLLDLFVQASSPQFLLEKETNHNMLQLLLQAMNAILEHQYEGTSPSNVRSFLRISCCSSTRRLGDATLDSSSSGGGPFPFV